MRRRPAVVAASWALAVLAAIAVAAAALLVYADRSIFRSEAFAERAAATLHATSVRDAAARRLTGVVLRIRPDLVALRPILETAARGVAGTPQFRSLVRQAALSAHRSAFDAQARDLRLQIRDAGVLVADAVRRADPGVAERIPARAVIQVARVANGLDAIMLRLAEQAERLRHAWWFALAAAAVLALAAFLVSDSRRSSAVRLGFALAFVGASVALTAAFLPAILTDGIGAADRDAAHAALGVWLDPITAWAAAAAVVGLVVALAAMAVVRPIPYMALLGTVRGALAAAPRNRLERALRAAAAVGAGGAMVAWPRSVLTAVIVVAGVLIAVVAAAELLALAAGSAGSAARARGPGIPSVLRIAAAAGLLTAGVAGVAALSDGEDLAAARAGRCNGHAALCDRRVDQVAFLGTHNAMAAAGEPGWFFAAQDAGIPQQLQDGVRALMIDTHYGIRSRRGVTTDLSGQTKSRAKLVDELGSSVVDTAERLRRRIGGGGTGKRAVFLCHGFCEVGATPAVQALEQVHRFLVRNPEEVVVLSIEDDTSAADTEAAIRSSGLIDEVYRGAARPPWPTLGDLVARDERVIVLTEKHAGDEPWMHLQPDVVQETPYRFRTVRELESPASCEPNRGGTAGSLLLVNHWIDTTPAPRATLARRVNARGFLTRRITRCRARRGMLPNLVAIDFYRQGDALQVVDELNGVQ